ncbi:MAG TPA: hypothetical protein DF427_03070 [Moraxellaceae bacterium]|nr:hypothetical protein [Moraxellaceae bacterium]
MPDFPARLPTPSAVAGALQAALPEPPPHWRECEVRVRPCRAA